LLRLAVLLYGLRLVALYHFILHSTIFNDTGRLKALYSGMKEKLIQAHVASHMQKPFKPRAWLRHTPYT
jgi:hypothetical protein